MEKGIAGSGPSVCRDLDVAALEDRQGSARAVWIPA